MAGIEGHILLQQLTDTLVMGTCDGLALTPEKSMVDEQQVGPHGGGSADGLLAGIHRKGHLPDFLSLRLTVLHLNSIQRGVAPIVFHVQKTTKIVIQLM